MLLCYPILKVRQIRDCFFRIFQFAFSLTRAQFCTCALFFLKGESKAQDSGKLKCSQYKNDAIQLKNFLILKLPPFSVTYKAKEKRRQFQTYRVGHNFWPCESSQISVDVCTLVKKCSGWNIHMIVVYFVT